MTKTTRRAMLCFEARRAGAEYRQIAEKLGVTYERARQLTEKGREDYAFQNWKALSQGCIDPDIPEWAVDPGVERTRILSRVSRTRS